MPVAHVRSKWSSGNLIFHEDTAGNGAAVHFGVSGTGLDVKFWGSAAANYMLWDESANDLLFAGAGGMSFGTLSSSAQTGITLSASNNSILNVFADDNNTTLTNAVYSLIRGRAMLFKDATGITLTSVKGQIKTADEVDFGPGVYAGVQGVLETMDDTDVQSGAKVWGVDSSFDITLASLTVDSGGIAAGFHAELTGAGTATQSSGGILAGLYIDEQVTSGQWGYGIYIASGAADVGIYVGGAISATNGRAMKISTSQAVPAMADGYGVIEKELTVTGTATAQVNAESSWINLGGSSTVPQYMTIHTDGIWDGGATLTTASVSMHKYSCALASNPAWLSVFELNYSSNANNVIDSIFNVNDAARALGYATGSASNVIGSIPIFSVGGSAIKYLMVYDGPAA